MSGSSNVSQSFPIASGQIELPIWYWLSGEGAVNFGDALSELFVARLFAEPRCAADVYHVVGSVISPHILQEHRNKGALRTVAFWGCGLREAEPLPARDREICQFFAIRGPLSRDLLGLPAETPLGDPGFLLPLLTPVIGESRRIGKVVAPHIFDMDRSEELAKRCGADAVISPVATASIEGIDELIRRIASAEFVLAGSLHAAVVAAAFDVPFAFLECGHIDIPFKWRDLAASLDIPPAFARTIEEGEIIYRELLKPRLRKPKLAPLLDACPFVVRPSMVAAAMLYDHGVSAREALLQVQALAALPGEHWEARRGRMEAQALAFGLKRQDASAVPAPAPPSKLEQLEARHEALGVLVASLQEQAAALAGGVAWLQEQMAATQDRAAAAEGVVQGLNGHVAGLQEQLAASQERAAAAEGVLQGLNGHVAGLQEQLAASQERAAAAEGVLQGLNGQVAGLHEQVAASQERIAATEGALAPLRGLDGQVAGLQEQVASSQERIAATEGALAPLRGLDGQVAGLQEQVAASQERAAAAEGALQHLDGQVAGLQEQMAASQERVAVTEGALAPLQELDGQVAGLQEQMAASQTRVAAAEGALAPLQGLDGQVAGLQEQVAALAGGVAASQERAAAAEVALAPLQGLDGQVAGLQEQVAALAGGVAASQERAAAAEVALAPLQGLDGQVAGLQEQVAALAGGVAASQERVAAAETAMAPLQGLDGLVAGLQEQVAALAGGVAAMPTLRTGLVEVEAGLADLRARLEEERVQGQAAIKAQEDRLATLDAQVAGLQPAPGGQADAATPAADSGRTEQPGAQHGQRADRVALLKQLGRTSLI